MGRLLPQLPGYEVVNRIGEGAGATISLGVERASRRQVAIKQVVSENEETDKFVTQAENEYEVAHQLDHPFLRKYYDIVRVKKWFKTREVFLVMEYIDGQRLEENVPSSHVDRVKIFIDVAEGLRAMHAAGFVHADIKPNNILLVPGNGVKIIDFGQSCPIGHRKERIQGTPDYMAPEQINRHPLDHRTDIYNLGASMYWTFTGKFFETGMQAAEPGSPQHVIAGRRDSQPPHELNPDIPLALSKLIMECCANRQDQRPRDMKAVISRLETAMHTLEKRAAETAANDKPSSGGPPGGDDEISGVSAAPPPDHADDTFWADLGIDPGPH